MLSRAPQLRPLSIPSASCPKSLLNGKRVLLVDDDPDQVYLVRNFFRGYAVAFSSVTCAEAALHLLRAGEHVDLLILDVMMPGMDGWELFSEIRRLPLHAHTPVLFLTCVLEEQHETRSNTRGGTCYSLAKPTTRARFHAALRTLLQE